MDHIFSNQYTPSMASSAVHRALEETTASHRTGFVSNNTTDISELNREIQSELQSLSSLTPFESKVIEWGGNQSNPNTGTNNHSNRINDQSKKSKSCRWQNSGFKPF